MYALDFVLIFAQRHFHGTLHSCSKFELSSPFTGPDTSVSVQETVRRNTGKVTFRAIGEKKRLVDTFPKFDSHVVILS